MITMLTGDCRELLRTLPDASVHCVVTSPPYWGLRSYGIGTENGELGLELDFNAYVAAMVAVFREVRRVLRDDGTLWLNLGDTYSSGGRDYPQVKQSINGPAGPVEGSRRAPVMPGLKPKDLCGIPWRVAFALQADGWYLRQDIIWSKPNPMPESVAAPWSQSHDYFPCLHDAGHNRSDPCGHRRRRQCDRADGGYLGQPGRSRLRHCSDNRHRTA